MDYRHTGDFARRMEAAELRAQQLRSDVMAAFWSAAGRAVRKLVHAALRRIQPQA